MGSHKTHHGDESEIAEIIRHEFRILGSKLEQMMSLLTDIQAKEAQAIDLAKQNNDLDQSIITILNADTQKLADLKAQLDAAIAAGSDPVVLKQISDTMDQLIATAQQQADAKKAAITANTPAA